MRRVLFGDEATSALEQLAERNANLSGVIRDLGHRILQLRGVGLRNGMAGEPSRTYDVDFVRPPAFAAFIAPSHEGTWTPRRPGQLRVRIRVNPRASTQIQDPHHLLGESTFGGGGGWHDIYADEESDVEPFLGLVRQAYGSFDLQVGDES